MNIVDGRITISKAKRHLGSEMTAAETNNSVEETADVACNESKKGITQITALDNAIEMAATGGSSKEIV